MTASTLLLCSTAPDIAYATVAAAAAEYYMGSMSWTHYTMEQLSDVTGDELYDDLMRSPVRHDEGMHGEGPGEELLDCILQVGGGQPVETARRV
jgi:hypothetical protein